MPIKGPEERRAYRAAYNAAHREECRAYHVAYRAAHREELRAYDAEYYSTHTEERRAWRAAHPEYPRAYNAAHRAELRAYRLAYNAAHREERYAYNASWQVAHPEVCREATRKRRALKWQIREVAPDQILTRTEWEKILGLANGRCFYCKRKRKLTQDHVIPLCKGGLHVAENVVAACKSCNCKKNVKIVTLF